MFENLAVILPSVVTLDGTSYALVAGEKPGKSLLAIAGKSEGFTGETTAEGILLAPLTAENALALRQRLAWLQPVTLGLQISAGFGDRLGLATPGHVQAVRGTGVAPIFAQQSVRENTRTGRSPQQVLDDAMWGAFASGWCEPWGADADHLKTLEDIEPFVAAGYTFYTIDSGDYVDDAVETDEPATLLQKAEALPWNTLESSLAAARKHFLQRFELDGLSLTFDEKSFYKALAKYGKALAHVVRMVRRMQELQGQRPLEIEISVDETGTTTTLLEHFYIVSELKRLDIPIVSLAPRFVGRFEKGVGYIGDLAKLEQNIAGHASIMRFFGESYKLSLHTGSDKFEVYPLAVHHTDGLVHLKTAGTSYLEALHLLAAHDRAFFREIWDFARGRYETDRRTYHVSATLEAAPLAEALSDEELPGLFDQFDARQILHVTFGSVLDVFGDRLHRSLCANLPAYHAYIQRHFEKHLAPFRQNAEGGSFAP
ncbi:MAG TPA: tagaturonate epimerase family protein [Ktedonobacteraceae bacterium]|nr:tagaturonate epimerase family protein [Ktedonobacteraceae bacterium]